MLTGGVASLPAGGAGTRSRSTGRTKGTGLGQDQPVGGSRADRTGRGGYTRKKGVGHDKVPGAAK